MADVPSPYPRGVGSKFDADGRVRHFPGNTIICHLGETSPLRAPLKRLYRALEASKLSSLYTLLPPSSWHMTVFEGVCDKVRGPGFWPADLPIDAPLEDCNEHFKRKLESFDLACQPPYRVAVSGHSPFTTGIAISLQPAPKAEEDRLRDLRDRLADCLLLRHPRHETYAFHLSLAYFLRHLAEEQSSELSALLSEHLGDMPEHFTLGAPEFCRFDDMFAFHRQFFLSDRAKEA